MEGENRSWETQQWLLKVPAEGTYQGAGDVSGLEEREADSWPLQSPGKSLFSPLHLHGSPTSHGGALSGFRQPPSLPATPVSKPHGLQ